MAFKDIYAITDINLKNKNQRMSFSIDEFDEVVPVILLVPDLKKHDHDHIELDLNLLETFLAKLSLKGGNYLNIGWYRLETEHSSEKDCLIDLKVFVFKSQNRKEGVDFLYKISLTRENLDTIKEWSEEFISKTQNDLMEKFNQDTKNRFKK